MHVRKIHIENIRGFQDGDQAINLDLLRPDGRLAGWTVLAGRNGAGKTTLLQAVAIALVHSPKLLPRAKGWVHQGKDGGSVEVEVQNGSLNKLQKLAVSWSLPQGGDVARGSAGSVELFVVGYGSFRRLSGHGADAQDLMSDQGTSSQVVTLFREDASLAETVQWLREVYLRRLEGKPGAQDLEESALLLLQDGLLPGSTQVERVDSDGLWVTRNGHSLLLTQLSDGFRAVAALVLDIIRHLHLTFQEFRLENVDGHWVAPYEGVVLIDEIETHLHVSWQQEIGFWLKEHFPNIQFIVTTHSPFICQAADPKGLIRLPTPGEERSAEHVPDELFHTIVNGTPDEASITELFGLDHAYSEHSDNLRQQLAELEFKLLRGQLATEESGKLKELSDQMPSTGSSAVERALRKLEVKP